MVHQNVPHSALASPENRSSPLKRVVLIASFIYFLYYFSGLFGIPLLDILRGFAEGAAMAKG